MIGLKILFKSCATPLASVPTLSMRWERRYCRSSCFFSVISLHEIRIDSSCPSASSKAVQRVSSVCTFSPEPRNSSSPCQLPCAETSCTAPRKASSGRSGSTCSNSWPNGVSACPASLRAAGFMKSTPFCGCHTVMASCVAPIKAACSRMRFSVVLRAVISRTEAMMRRWPFNSTARKATSTQNSLPFWWRQCHSNPCGCPAKVARTRATDSAIL